MTCPGDNEEEDADLSFQPRPNYRICESRKHRRGESTYHQPGTGREIRTKISTTPDIDRIKSRVETKV